MNSHEGFKKECPAGNVAKNFGLSGIRVETIGKKKKRSLPLSRGIKERKK